MFKLIFSKLNVKLRYYLRSPLGDMGETNEGLKKNGVRGAQRVVWGFF